MELNYYRDSWPLTLTNCPCDLHFTQYLAARQVEGKSIFHFGTGVHHLLGKNNYEKGNPNEILAITASRGEYEAYMDWIIENPLAANGYKVLYGDIYTLSPRTIPTFDLVTLFHLCEFYDEQKSAYARLNDVGLLELFLAKLNPGGKVLFFTKSGAYDRKGCKAAIIVNRFLAEGRLVAEEEYETLLVCRPLVGQ